MVEKDSLRPAVFREKNGSGGSMTAVSKKGHGDKKKYLTPERACDRITTP